MFIDDNSKCTLQWVFVDKNYLLPKVTCKYNVGDSFLTFIASGNRQKQQQYVLKNFRRKTALQAENSLIKKLNMLCKEGCDILPRHLHDCLYQVFYDLGLDLGYVSNPLRPLALQ